MVYGYRSPTNPTMLSVDIALRGCSCYCGFASLPTGASSQSLVNPTPLSLTHFSFCCCCPPTITTSEIFEEALPSTPIQVLVSLRAPFIRCLTPCPSLLVASLLLLPTLPSSELFYCFPQFPIDSHFSPVHLLFRQSHFLSHFVVFSGCLAEMCCTLLVVSRVKL